MKPPHWLHTDFHPASFAAWRDYSLPKARQDLLAGITVGIVAIPLALAFAIASGARPEQGLVTAIVAGFIISLLGGSRTQIGGPTGAFIVILYGVMQRHGPGGLALATLMAGIILVLLGTFRLGRLVRYIPPPVIIGFTAGIAAIIFSGQVKDFFGLAIPKLPADFLHQWLAYAHTLATLNGPTVALGILALAIITAGRELKLPIPPAIIAVIATAMLVWALNLPVETIGTRFGGIPQHFPGFQGSAMLASLNLATVQSLLPDAITIAMLGAIESLLSALVADGMTGNKHNSNTELIAQGLANIASVLAGGIAATGAIARTGLNIRTGAQSPTSGMVHSIFLLVVMLILAPLASFIPLAGLAAVLFVVSWDMSEKHQVRRLLHEHKAPAVIMLVTLLLTVFSTLSTAVAVGTALAFLLTHGHHVLRPRQAVELYRQARLSDN